MKFMVDASKTLALNRPSAWKSVNSIQYNRHG